MAVSFLLFYFSCFRLGLKIFVVCPKREHSLTFDLWSIVFCVLGDINGDNIP